MKFYRIDWREDDPAAHAADDIRHESQMGNWQEQKRREKQRLGIK